MADTLMTMDESVFDEHKSREHIIGVWGPAGAHIDVFDHMLNEIERLSLLLIEATNPGIDMEKVKAFRSTFSPE